MSDYASSPEPDREAAFLSRALTAYALVAQEGADDQSAASPT